MLIHDISSLCKMFKLIVLLSFTSLTNVIQFVDANSRQFKNPVSWSTEFVPSVATTESSNPYLDQNRNHYQNSDNQSDIMSFSSPLEPYFEAQREAQLTNTKQQQLNWSNDQILGNKFGDNSTKQVSALQPMNTSASVQWSSPIRSVPAESNLLYPQLQLQLQPQQHQYQAINFQDPAIDQLNRFDHLSAISNPTDHNYITSSLLSRQPLNRLPHLAHVDQMFNAITNDFIPRAGILKGASFLPASFEQLPFRHNPILLRPHISTKSPWFKSFTAKRRSYEQPPTSDAQQITPRIAKVNFDDSIDVTRLSKEPEQQQQQHQLSSSQGLKEYLTPYSTMPLVFDLPPSMEKKNMKITSSTSEEDHLGSYSDGIFAVASKSPSYSHAMPHYYSAYPYAHHVTPRKGLEKSLGLSILVGIGAALISFLIISNLFLSVPLFAMTLLQLLQGNNIFPNMQPNNYNNNNNIPPNNSQNQNGSGPSTNGRKRRDLHELELEERVRKAISNIYL